MPSEHSATRPGLWKYFREVEMELQSGNPESRGGVIEVRLFDAVVKLDPEFS